MWKVRRSVRIAGRCQRTAAQGDRSFAGSAKGKGAPTALEERHEIAVICMIIHTLSSYTDSLARRKFHHAPATGGFLQE
jgi:hypothetical protein